MLVRLRKVMFVLMKIFFVSFFIFIGFIFPSASFASHIELSECVEIAHCVREEWEVDSIEQPFKEIKEIIENTPRSVSYTHLTLPTSDLV